MNAACGATLTVLGYLSIGDVSMLAAPPTARNGSLVLKVPADRQEFAVGCLALGIGSEGGDVVAALAAASWFSHLRRTTHGPLRGTGRAAVGVLAEVLRCIRGPHVVSVALPKQPDQAELDAACAAGRAARRRGAFTMATVSRPGPAALAALGGTFDCVVEGDGGLHHHWYPARTVTEPRHGHIVGYDFHDVRSLWAGRVGTYGVVRSAADALHVEVSAEVDNLAEIDRLASGMAAGLDDPGRLRLFNVVEDLRAAAVAVSFSDSLIMRKEWIAP